MRIRWSWIISLLLVSVWAIQAQAETSMTMQQMIRDASVQIPKQHKPAPLFSLPLLSGGELSLEDFHGKFVLLHFWATWCVPCRHEMPLLYSMEQSMNDKNIRVIYVNVNRQNMSSVQSFLDQVSPKLHTLLDTSGQVRNRYAVRGLPTSYLIDQNGYIVGRMIGARDWTSPTIKNLIQMLSQQP